jgi:hypothetical protein
MKRKFRSSVTGQNLPQVAGNDYRLYTDEFCAAMNQIDPRAHCPNGCEWIAPFGWVPNASCSKHA